MWITASLWEEESQQISQITKFSGTFESYCQMETSLSLEDGHSEMLFVMASWIERSTLFTLGGSNGPILK